MRAAWLGLVLVACVGTGKVTRMPTPTATAVGVLLEAEGRAGALPAPAEVIGELAATLKARNLITVNVAAELAAKRSTADRLALVAAGAGNAPIVTLIETRASFYAQIEGRYRWTIRARVTVAKADALDKAESEDVELPVVLRFDHQREADALAEAAPQLAGRVGIVMDRFLAGLPGATVARAPAASRRPDAIYFVLVDRFADGRGGQEPVDAKDPQAWHGGDLAGLRERLDHIADLGFTTVWLSPVFDARDAKFEGFGAFHGYWTDDLGAVEPRFGTEDDLVALGADLHARGMKLYLDLVLNHVGWDAPVRQEHPDWFHHFGPIEDWGDPVQLEEHDVHGLPDLALEKDAVYAWALAHATRWIDRVQPDGYRLDAVRHIPLTIWTRFARDVHAHAGAKFELLGELLDGAPAALATTFGAGFDALFDFPLGFAIVEAVCDGAPVGKIAAIFSQDRLYADPTRLVTLLDNHDLPRVASRCQKDHGKIAQALTIQLTSRGTPSITYGTEAALEGDHEPQNRGDMRWTPLPLAGAIRDGLAARRAHPALVSATTRVLAAERTFAAWARLADDEAVVVAVNTGDAARTVAFGGQTITVAAHETVTAPVDGDFAALRGKLASRAVEVAASGAPGGGELVLVGGGPELGSWDPKKAPRFADGRVVVSLPAPGAYGAKLAVVRADGSVTWQDGADRILFVPEGKGADRWSIKWGGGDAWRRSS